MISPAQNCIKQDVYIARKYGQPNTNGYKVLQYCVHEDETSISYIVLWLDGPISYAITGAINIDQ